MVCADSYFASFGAAKELFRIGLCFIKVVKTATRGYPNLFLQVSSCITAEILLSFGQMQQKIVQNLGQWFGWKVSAGIQSQEV
jgi:hypothetical protein